MGIYIICILSIAIISFVLKLTKISKQKLNTIVIWLSFIEMLLIASLRNVTVGTDTINYKDTFITISHLPWKDIFSVHLEPGFVVYCKTLGLFTTNPIILFAVSETFILLSYCLFIKNYSKDITLSILLFIGMTFFFHSMNILRQMMAMAIATYSIKYIENSKFLNFLIINFIAITFHFTAIIMLLLYPLKNFKLSFLNALFILFGCFIITQTIGQQILQNAISTVYVNYTLDSSFQGGLSMLLFLVIVTFSGFFILNNNDKENKIICTMMLLACCLQFLALDLSLFARVVQYMSIAMIIYIPNVIYQIKNTNVKILIKSGCFLFILAYYLIIGLSVDLDGVVPYVFL